MKNKILLGSLLLAWSAASLATPAAGSPAGHLRGKNRKTSSVNLSTRHRAGVITYMAQAQFYSDFPGATVLGWRRSGDFQEADFVQDHTTYTAFYDDRDELVGTTTTKTLADLPQNARRYLAEKYAGYTPSEVIYFADNEDNETDMVMYGIPVADEDNYFVLLRKPGENLVVKVSPTGTVSYFKKI
ncbi:MAG TPA: hypothetical protein VG870_10895 [Chitinophagaceae bacterium]|nr:hypothetical protein [Chitinophagaceae bacterium]